MTRFNKATPAASTKTINLAGGPARKMDKRLDLFSSLVTTFLEDKFYENAKERMSRLSPLASECPPEFVAKCAVWARTQGNMRTAPLFLTAVLTKLHSGDDLVRRTVGKVVNRADEMAELLAAYQMLYGEKSPWSRQMMKGIGDCFNKFDEFQFSKYNRDGKFRLKDALFLAHPKAKNKAQSKLFDKIAEDKLKVADTWETTLTATGEDMKDASEEEKAEAKSDSWATLIEEKKLGHMALLRNLRNLLDANLDKKTLATAAKQLCDEKAVRNGKQFPFRYLAAYQEIQKHGTPGASVFLDALEDAIAIAGGNIPGFSPSDEILIASDVSGSMGGTISDKSKISVRKVGLMLGAMLRAYCKNVQMGVFADHFVPIPTSKHTGIIETCLKLDENAYGSGGGTNGGSILAYALNNDVKADKVLIFTDCEMWGETYVSNDGRRLSFEQMWDLYKKKVPEARLYIVNVAGYGTTPVSLKRKDVVYVAGWTEKVFSLLEMMDNGEKMVNEICKIEL